MLLAINSSLLIGSDIMAVQLLWLCPSIVYEAKVKHASLERLLPLAFYSVLKQVGVVGFCFEYSEQILLWRIKNNILCLSWSQVIVNMQDTGEDIELQALIKMTP